MHRRAQVVPRARLIRKPKDLGQTTPIATVLGLANVAKKISKILGHATAALSDGAQTDPSAQIAPNRMSGRSPNGRPGSRGFH